VSAALSIAPIERLNLLLAAGAVAVSLALATPNFALSVGVGAVLEAVNLRGLQRTAQMLFSGGAPGRLLWSAGFGLRFTLLALAVGVAIYSGAHPVGLLIGLSLVVPAAIIGAWRARPPIDEGAPALSPDDESWDRWNPWLARETEEEEDR
jgi:hypothetical protein